MSKWIETQQIISKERNEWQQGKEILVSRLELVRNEAIGLDQAIRSAQAQIADAQVKQDELLAERAKLDEVAARLTQGVEAQEQRLRTLFPELPEPLQKKLQPLFQRMPTDDAAKARVSIAERFQNVLGMLGEINRASTDISVNFEVHTLSDGKPSEVKAIYVGLAQAYYVNANGEAGIGHPTPQGWKWEPSKSIADNVLMTLEILEGKHSPEFVPLPVKLP
ncbi:MAG: DUF3450 family protein [Planctomycetes bacterium]|nr:DUF3450 family protein [Planctomycetota bacterium]